MKSAGKNTPIQGASRRIELQEARQGDPGYALARLNAMTSIAVAEIFARARTIAADLIGEKGLPEKAALDALHIGIAADCQSQFLLTWNFRHIANAQMRGKIEAILTRRRRSFDVFVHA